MPDEDIHARTYWRLSILAAIPSLDFLVWNRQPYVVVRRKTTVDLKELPISKNWNYGSGIDFGGDDAEWLERKDLPLQF